MTGSAVKVAESYPTFCDPMDYSPQGSSVHGILQARVLEWVALPLPGDLPDPGIEPTSLMSSALAGAFFTTNVTQEVSCVLSDQGYMCTLEMIRPYMCSFPKSKAFQGSHWTVLLISELHSSTQRLLKLPFPQKVNMNKLAGGSEDSTLDAKVTCNMSCP